MESPSPEDSNLMAATVDGDVEAALAALAAGANPNYSNSLGMRPLLICCGGSGPLEMLDALLAAGAACDATDSEGWTALHYAASSGQGELVARLIKAGAPLNAVTRDRGWTPLTRAAFRSCPHVIEALLAAGADSSLQTEVSLCVAWNHTGRHKILTQVPRRRSSAAGQNWIGLGQSWRPR